jgi:ribosome maturation factor RimP
VKALSPIETRLAALIEPAAEAEGFRLVRVRLMGGRRKTLQVMAERLADAGMGLEDCRRLSRTLSLLLDEADPISDDYVLEVSSPGIDRPLVRLEDFARFAGHEAKIETALMIDGRKRFKGVIRGVEGDQIVIGLPEGEDVRFAFSALAEARLVLTDRLIAEDLKRAKADEAERDLTPPPPSGGGQSEARGGGKSSSVGASPLSHAARDSSPVNGGAARRTKS